MLPLVLHTDASNEGLGAVLYEKQGGIDRVIAYASRSLRGAERLYPAHKPEFQIEVIVRKGSHPSMTNNIQLSLIKDISKRIIIRFNLELTAVQIFMKLNSKCKY
jgi:hypothetical protein